VSEGRERKEAGKANAMEIAEKPYIYEEATGKLRLI
jgi:hypothetical protein